VAFSAQKMAVMKSPLDIIKKLSNQGTCMAQSEECVILDLGVMSSSPTLGVEITKDKKAISS